MTDARVKTKLWVQAYLRRRHAEGVGAMVARRGDPDAGAVIVKIALMNGTARVFTQFRDEVGAMCWREKSAIASEADADAAIAREAEFDPDIWVVEVEDKTGAHALTETVEEAPAN